MATEIVTRQIKDGAVTAVKIPAGANIETTKLQDGADFIKRTGTVPFTAAQSMGNQKLSNVGTPTTGSNDAARIVDVENAVANLASIYKYRSARVASTVSITLASPGSTMDGVTLVSGDRVLLKNQSTTNQNGIYIWTGAAVLLTRAPDADAWNEFPGQVVTVSEGAQASANGTAEFRCTVDDGGTLNTTAIVYVAVGSVGLANANFVDKETPAGTINGSNTAFTLANTPVAGSEHLHLNGLLLDTGDDYTIAGAAITMTVAPTTGEKLRCSYRK